VHDFINGFFILLENQYDIGDTVRIAGVKGTVERMNLRQTVRLKARLRRLTRMQHMMCE